MIIQTRCFGEMEIEGGEVLTFSAGIVGMKHLKRFVILDLEDHKPLRLMQSLDDPGVCFPVIEPRLFRPDYRIAIHEGVLAEISMKDRTEVLVLCIVTYCRDPQTLTANLQGPLLINGKERIGKQFILTEGQYHPRHDILKELGNSGPSDKTDRQGPILEIKNHK